MPELPEVETVRRGLAPVLEGRVLARVTVRRKDLRVPFPRGFARKLEGRRVERLARRAKYLLWHLDGNLVLISHLGMSGRFTVGGDGDGQHDHVVFDTDEGTRIVYTDHRRFGLMDLARPGALESHPLLAGLGIEPLDAGLGGAWLRKAFVGRRAPVKAALLDQKLIAGLGNIYVCEALYRARISPKRACGSIGPARAERLAAAIREVIGEAIEAGGSSLRDYAQASGELGLFQHRFRVYDREGEPCPDRGCGPIARIVQSGRSTFYCPGCQR